jgi:hypothetical protein
MLGKHRVKSGEKVRSEFVQLQMLMLLTDTRVNDNIARTFLVMLSSQVWQGLNGDATPALTVKQVSVAKHEGVIGPDVNVSPHLGAKVAEDEQVLAALREGSLKSGSQVVSETAKSTDNSKKGRPF